MMQIKSLQVSQMRAFEQAEFQFEPGMNLIVGINGVGKSTLLDALRILCSQILSRISVSSSKTLAFSVDDITFGRGALTTEIRFEVGGINFNYLAHFPREGYIENKDQEGHVRGQTADLIEHYRLEPDDVQTIDKVRDRSPLAVYFSTHRSLASLTSSSRRSIAGGKAAAYNDALIDRELRLREFADWWLVQEVLAEETDRPKFGKNMSILSETISRFLDGIKEVRAVKEPQTTLLLQKNGALLDVRQLSDGERGVLSLILDLARRMAIANPELEDPIREGQAVVLIDELDLHLHPGWQREIVGKLTSTFPKCQFIATTHSPQIVGEVQAQNIILIEPGKEPYRPEQSLGMDTNWILRFLMGTVERNIDSKKVLKEIASLIEDEKYDEAVSMIDSARNEYGESIELIKLQTRIDRIRLLGE